jgi:colanic acid/amylovoran biosynthesis protein
MKFFYAGQMSMGNRGCEALIRSNTMLIRERYPDARFFCPSEDEVLDRKQWPQAAEMGVDFTSVMRFPRELALWSKILKVTPSARGVGVLPIRLDRNTRQAVANSDAVLMTGGDIISLDYGLSSLYYWVGIVNAARRLGKPTHLLAASVGPFTADPVVERQMAAHLKRYTSITVRETASQNYLHNLGIDAKLVADPAFVLMPEQIDTSEFMVPGRDYLGLNVSPLVRKFRNSDASRAAFDADIVNFVKKVVTETSLDVIMIPHVDPLSGSHENSDRSYLKGLLQGLAEFGERVRITPDLLNAAQIKYVLGKCRYFMGARTHATVGALSQGVPTISIAYSIKAVGINQDLFNSTDCVLPTPEVSMDTLLRSLAFLQNSESALKATLAERIPVWKDKARMGISML